MESFVASPTQSYGPPKNEPNFTGSFSSGLEKELDDSGIMSDEDEWSESQFFNDDHVLEVGCGWIQNNDDASQPQMQQVWVTKSDCRKSDFVQMLKKIGCEKRFAARSVDYPGAFYAWLTEDEAEKLIDVEGIHSVVSCSYIVLLH